MPSTASESEIKRFSLEVGDIMFTKDSESFDDIANSAVVVEELKDIICGYHLAHVRADRKYLVPNYLSKLFQSVDYNYWFQINATGITRVGLGLSAIRNSLTILPPISEQTQIATYLDTKTTAIDKKIILLKRKIKHYKAYRKTLIYEAVTKGLDKKVKLKNSDIDWIGKIPEHWEVKRIKDIFNTLAGGTPSTKEASYWIGDIPWIPSGAVQNGEVNKDIVSSYISEEALLKSSTKIAKRDSILIALTGATCSNIGYLNFDTTINQSIVSIDSNHKVASHRYYFYFLVSAKEKIRTLMTGGAQGGINQGDIKYFKVCFTSNKEQKQIADFLDAKATSIDLILKNIEIQINTLKEFRKTLINEVVTGKVKVSSDLQ
jgi:type I restriction enzyme S subunit